MVESHGIGPTDPSKSYPSQPKIDIRDTAERIHTTISYAAKDPKAFEESFLSLAILMHLEEKNILTDDEHRSLSKELTHLSESLHDGSLRIKDLKDHLTKVVEDIKYHNHKAKVLSSIVELEHLLCIHPPGDHPHVNIEDFQKVIDPLFMLLHRDVSTIQATSLYKDIESIKQEAYGEKINPFEALDRLKYAIEDILKQF